MSNAKFPLVTKSTRAPKAGRVIHCPHCGAPNVVYHFSWCGVTCDGCKRMVDKYKWIDGGKNTWINC